MTQVTSRRTAASVEAIEIPTASLFTSSPLRNRIRVELDVSVSEVWELMGDLTRFPEYSVGLEKVEAKSDENGTCSEYTCYFKPQEEGGAGMAQREIMLWFEPNRGYASIAEEPDNTFAFMTLEPTQKGTRMNYDMHFDAEDLEAAKTALDEALVDIAENLIRRFGGRVVERYVER